MKTVNNTPELKWHLQNNVEPKLTPVTIERILQDVESFNEGRVQLDSIITQGVTIGQMFEDLKIEVSEKFNINDAVIVNTGGNDTPGYVCYPTRNIHGFYWEAQDAYCIHFNNGTKQYIPAKYIKAA